jgi:hypothetical protein
MMKEAIAFIRKFIKLDHLVRMAKWEEKDDDLFDHQLSQLNSMYHGDGNSDIYRVRPSDPGIFARAKEMINVLQEKKLFRVEKYGSGEDQYKAYISSSFAGDNSIFTTLFFGMVDQEMKILGEFDLCMQCKGSGLIHGQQCATCGGEGWLSRAGMKFKKLDHPTERQDFLTPSNEEQFK